MRWFFALMRADLDFIIFVDIAALEAAWSYYKDGRLKEAAKVLATAAEAGEAGIIAVGQGEANALGEKYPRGVWLGACPQSYGSTDPVELYLLLGGREGAAGEMCILPASMYGPHGEILCITEELLEAVSLEALDD